MRSLQARQATSRLRKRTRFRLFTSKKQKGASRKCDEAFARLLGADALALAEHVIYFDDARILHPERPSGL